MKQERSRNMAFARSLRYLTLTDVCLSALFFSCLELLVYEKGMHDEKAMHISKSVWT